MRPEETAHPTHEFQRQTACLDRPTACWVRVIHIVCTLKGLLAAHLSVHVVVCEETWETIDEQGERPTKTARHAWLSSQPLRRDTVHERCNLGARHRWGIEAGFLVELYFRAE